MSTMREWIWLSLNIPYNKNSTFLQYFSQPREIFTKEKEILLEVFTEYELKQLNKRDFSQVDRILNECFEKDINIISINDTLYPESLKNIENPPFVLYTKGRLPNFSKKLSITIVGTRNASAYAIISTKQITYTLAENDIIIVSGMAYGVDSTANETALLAKGTSVAVLGCSPDIIYPQEKEKLYHDMACTGCLISEYPPTTRPAPQNFPRRNRILSALTKATLVIEAPLNSGSLITAKHAKEQGKTIFTIPGNISQKNAEGSNLLLKNGAKIVLTPNDILSEFNIKLSEKQNYKREVIVLTDKQRQEFEKRRKSKNYKQKPYESAKIRENNREIEKKDEHNIENITVQTEHLKYPENLDEKQQIVYNLLKDGHKTLERITQLSKIDSEKVLAILTLFELLGVAKKENKKYFIKEG